MSQALPFNILPKNYLDSIELSDSTQEFGPSIEFLSISVFVQILQDSQL